MRICFPVEGDNGLESQVSGHFGQAPAFLVVDTDSMQVQDVIQPQGDRVHGQCRPVAMLKRTVMDAICVGGIGQGAIANLAAQRIRVLRAVPGTVQQNIDLFKAGKLGEFPAGWTCEEGGHGHHGQGSCGHGGGRGG
jgi:predicted Fe-Mo cluster-binding NifX family protein